MRGARRQQNPPKATQGSSPRMRGALQARYHHIRRQRIIPADAGSTVRADCRLVRRQDHPRGCGEHSDGVWDSKWGKGSSPRMRGAPKWKCEDSRPQGIIPADAGSTCPTCSRPATREDHPRGCVEHSSRPLLEAFSWGSSLRMRGAHHDSDIIILTHRIIPADAGSTVVRVGKHDKLAGSSPRMRGALTATVSPVPRERDHPRGCGEHLAMAASCDWSAGSSPRMRGARRPGSSPAMMVRIIPADAGSTGTGSTRM